MSPRADLSAIHLQPVRGAIERANVRADTRGRELLPLRALRHEEQGGAHRPDAEPARAATGYRRDPVATARFPAAPSAPWRPGRPAARGCARRTAAAR